MVDQAASPRSVMIKVLDGWHDGLRGTKTDEMIAALKEAGYQMVPIEPTADMLRAGDVHGGAGKCGPYPITEDVWRAMLAASQHQEKG